MTDSLFAAAYQCLVETDLDRKGRRGRPASGLACRRLVVDRGVDLPDVTEAAGRTSFLVEARGLSKRGAVRQRGARRSSTRRPHQFNAINRPATPSIASANAKAFSATGSALRRRRHSTSGCWRGRLQELGHDYGDFPRIAGLWTWRSALPATCSRAWRSCARARGAWPDVTPGIMERLAVR